MCFDSILYMSAIHETLHDACTVPAKDIVWVRGQRGWALIKLTDPRVYMYSTVKINMTEQASLDLEYISVGCNRTPHCVDWNVNGLLAYGADKSTALARETRVGGVSL